MQDYELEEISKITEYVKSDRTCTQMTDSALEKWIADCAGRRQNEVMKSNDEGRKSYYQSLSALGLRKLRMLSAAPSGKGISSQKRRLLSALISQPILRMSNSAMTNCRIKLRNVPNVVITRFRMATMKS